MTTRIALAGLGAAARQIHLPAYAKVDDLEVVGGCDPTATGSFPFPRFDSVDALLADAKPDILAVITPTDTHFELTSKGLSSGCHVLCEKPFMPSLDEARRIVALAREADRRVVVNNQYRFMNIHQESRRLVGSADLGELVFISAHQTFHTSEQTEAGWRGADTQRTCKEFGIHVIDLCRFFYGEDPVSITARMPKGGSPDGPDLLNLLQLEFPGDKAAHITLDRLCRGRHEYLNMRLDGTAGCVETRLGGGIAVEAGIRGGGSRAPFFHVDVSMGGRARLYHGEKFRKIATDPIDVFANATAGLMKAFLAALQSGDVPPCDASDNIKTLALVYAAYESDATRSTIEMSYEV